MRPFLGLAKKVGDCKATVGGRQAGGGCTGTEARWCGSVPAPFVLPGRCRRYGPRNSVSNFSRASRRKQDHAEPAAGLGGESGGVGEEEVTGWINNMRVCGAVGLNASVGMNMTMAMISWLMEGRNEWSP